MTYFGSSKMIKTSVYFAKFSPNYNFLYTLTYTALKKILTSYEQDGEITKEDIEGFLNEMGSFPSDEEIIRKIEIVDHDGKYISVILFLK